MTDLPVATFCADDLLRGAAPARIGSRVIVLPECPSTNDVAFDMAAAAHTDGWVVLSDHQSAGRGRHGRPWRSPRGASILCSVALECPAGIQPVPTPSLRRDAETPPRSAAPAAWCETPGADSQTLAGRFTLAAAVAACEAVRETTELEPSIKWPNDLRIAQRKLAGILIESRVLGPVPGGRDANPSTVNTLERRVWVIGIGINCLQQAVHFPPELRETATSLEIESQSPIDRPAVARSLLWRLDAWLGAIAPRTPAPDAQESAAQRLHAAWLGFAEPIGGYVRLRSGGREYAGRMVSVDPAGGLVVQVDEHGPMWFDPMQTQLL